MQYNPAADSTLETKKGKKRKLDDSLAEGSSKKIKKEEFIEGAQDFVFPEPVVVDDTPSGNVLFSMLHTRGLKSNEMPSFVLVDI